MKTKWTLFCVVLSLCLNISRINAQVNVQDSLALVDLYNSTNGPNWVEQTNWLTSNPVSTWFGVAVTGTRVTGIDLEYGLKGSIPSSIGNLINLTSLRLWNNNLSGNIPSSIGNLVNLQELVLGGNEVGEVDNGLTGNIPSSLGNLKSLQTLALDGNRLTGSIPVSIANLKNLIWLSLISNQLSGSIPTAITNLANLRYLFLSFNQLSGNIPSSIGNLANLVELELNNNQLSGSIPNSIGKLINLYELFLQNNKLSGHIPSSIGNLADRLVYLYLSNNQLNGTIPSSIGNLKALFLLDLSSNHLTDSIPSSIGNLENLDYLELNDNRLAGPIPSSFRNLRSQMYQTLGHNDFTFDGMELVAKRFLEAKYDHQKNIPVNQSGNTLSVSAGGKLINNTYKLLKWNGPSTYKLIAINYGDSVFHPAVSGIYQVKILNSVATGLVLYSKVIRYGVPESHVIASAENELQQAGKTNAFRVYPNPAKDILHVETNGTATFSLVDQSGKVLLTTNIYGKGVINVSSSVAGVYYLKNNDTHTVQKVVIER